MRGLDRIVASIAATQHGVVARWQLFAAGVPVRWVEERLVKGSLIRVFPGVHRVGHVAPSVEAKYMAAVLACGEGAKSGACAGSPRTASVAEAWTTRRPGRASRSRHPPGPWSIWPTSSQPGNSLAPRTKRAFAMTRRRMTWKRYSSGSRTAGREEAAQGSLWRPGEDAATGITPPATRGSAIVSVSERRMHVATTSAAARGATSSSAHTSRCAS
jgi:hypothetical protein